jgi:hypothetical protein
MERNVSLAMAKAIAEGAIEHCASRGTVAQLAALEIH